MNVIMYGILICPDCEEALALLQKEEKIQVDFRDFNLLTTNIKEFLKLRDTNSMFDEIREAGNIGIPLFVFEDGSMTFNVQEVIDIANQ